MEPKTTSKKMKLVGPKTSDRVRNLTPYDPVSSMDLIKANKNISHFKLDWNESTISPSPRVQKTLVDFLQNGSRLNWYPDMCYAPLYERLANYVGCRVSQLILTNGSDGALDLLCQCFLDPEDEVVHPVPTYNHMLQFAVQAGGKCVGVRCKNPLVPSLEELEGAITEKTKILYLANPNNPTGNVYSPAEMLNLAVRHPDILVVSDEAYFEFSGVSCASLVSEVSNLVVTRSFSKCFGLAALRIGYLIAQESVVQELKRAFNPKSVNMLAQISAAAALDDLAYYRNFIREIKRSGTLVKAFCDRHGIYCRPTSANFVLIQFPDAPAMAKKMSAVGIHVRDRSSQLPGMVRMSLGTESQTVEILSRLEKILADESYATEEKVVNLSP
jgi:histidinol-phosphate aminotransferase